MLKARELINQSNEELEAQYEDICRDIFELTNELRVSRKLEKPHELKEKKKDRARILTVLRQKKSKGSA
ncbi:MAG: 50S ribosomal protein L29 [Simkaniaceae bacterium]|nr:50S ribosomal protein L29 [Simkaniaceae bacterium]